MQKYLFTVMFVGAAVVACGSTDIEGDFSSNLSTKAGGTGALAPGACDPEGLPTIDAVDPNTLPKCTGGKGSARCVPTDKLGAFADKIKAQAAAQAAGAKFLDTCAGGYCIPDELVKSGGAAPETCTSLNGDGVCLDLSIPLVGQYDTLLPKDKCSDTQRCAPCNNPLAGGAPTGACLIGHGPKPGQTCSGGGSTAKPATKAQCPYTGPPLVKTDGFAACGEGAHCVPATIVADENQRRQLSSCKTSDGATGFCAPDKFIETAGNFIPATCKSLAGGEGRCTNIVIPMVAAQKGFLPQDTCAASERCAPCFNPADGKATGACILACDKPANTKPVLFPACGKAVGDTRGVCVPTTIIPQAMQSFLKQGTCPTGTDLCAPKQVVAADPSFKPATCSGEVKILGGILGSIAYANGVCLPDLINTPGDQGTCQNAEECVPCVNPVSKAATGAPGCPAAAK